MTDSCLAVNKQKTRLLSMGHTAGSSGKAAVWHLAKSGESTCQCCTSSLAISTFFIQFVSSHGSQLYCVAGMTHCHILKVVFGVQQCLQCSRCQLTNDNSAADDSILFAEGKAALCSPAITAMPFKLSQHISNRVNRGGRPL